MRCSDGENSGTQYCFGHNLFKVDNMLTAIKIADTNCLYCSEKISIWHLVQNCVFLQKHMSTMEKKSYQCMEIHYNVCFNMVGSPWLVFIYWRNPTNNNINSPRHYNLKTLFKEKLLNIGRTSKYFIVCFLHRITSINFF